jgi:hypothetical protein
MATNIPNNNSKEHECKACNFVTSRKNDLERHFLTSKHREATKLLQNSKKYDYKCNICHKEYKHHSSLWKHKKSCVLKNNSDEEISLKNNDILNYLMQENNQLKNIITELTNVIKTLKNNSNSQ